MTTPYRIRVVVVAPIMVKFDAISMSARDMIRALRTDPVVDVCHMGCTCEFPDIDFEYCETSSDLLKSRRYLDADIAIFHFGIYHSLFDSLYAAGPPVRIVCFHNITPKRFVDTCDHEIIERSFQQIEALRYATEIWAVSDVNARELLNRGFRPEQVRLVPLIVDDPSPMRLADKQHSIVNILYMGRIVPAKGLIDLVDAIGRADMASGSYRLTIAGNTTWSDPVYISEVKSAIRHYALENHIDFVGRIDEVEKVRLFRNAHILAIPSYHEGFCRPVVEGHRTGAVPVVYDGYNLPFVVANLGRVIPAGNVSLFGQAIRDLCEVLPLALTETEKEFLPLDCGMTSVSEFDRSTQRHIEQFTFQSVSAQIRHLVRRLGA